MKHGLPVTLDQSKPFVMAVIAVMDGTGTVDDAVAALRIEEERCGVGVWREPEASCLPPGVYLPRSFADVPRLDKTLCLLADWDAFGMLYKPSWDPDNGIVHFDVTGLQRYCLFPFLSRAHFILNGHPFTSDHCVIYSNGVLESWTSRAWGATLSAWANDADWAPHWNKKGHKFRWDYVSFYINLNREIVERYEDWEATVFDVLERKTELCAAATGPN